MCPQDKMAAKIVLHLNLGSKIFVQTVELNLKNSNHAWCALIGLHATWAVGVPVFLIVEQEIMHFVIKA